MMSRLKGVARSMASFRPLGVTGTLVLRAVGLIDQAKRFSRACDYHPKVVTIRHNGLRVQMYGADGRDQIPNEIWWKGWKAYEPPMPDLFVAAVRDARVVVDVGANTGFYTLLTLAGSGAVVHAFEPYPVCLEWLSANIKLQPDTSRVRVHVEAVSDAPGTTQLYIPKDVVHHGLLETSCSLDPEFRSQHEQAIEVKVVTLDDVFAGPEGEMVDVMKVDVEGMESKVFLGAKELLRRARPLIFLEILEKKYAPSLAEAFQDLDYTLVSIDESGCITRPGFEHLEGVTNYAAIADEKLTSFRSLVQKVGVPWTDAVPV